MAARDGKTIRASDWAEAGRKIRNDEGSILHGVIAEVHSLDHLHGAKQPGRLQRGVRLIELRRSEGVGLGGIRLAIANDRSEERRVGKEWRLRWASEYEEKKRGEGGKAR